MAVTAGTAACAQSNTNAAPQPPRVTIDSVSGFFDGNGHKAIYSGNVRVDDPQMKLRCELLTVDLPQSGEHVSHIVAETNVVIDATDEKGATNHATCDKAVYDYNVNGAVTNETITLTGNPLVKNAHGTQAGDVITWDRANNGFQFINPHMVFNQGMSGALAGTNAPSATTNESSAPKINFPPGADTNFPPGKLDLAPQRHSDIPPPQDLQHQRPYGR
jgi:lipopolysaccharide transport protein LptA